MMSKGETNSDLRQVLDELQMLNGGTVRVEDITDEDLLEGPQKVDQADSQDDIDRLLASID